MVVTNNLNVQGSNFRIGNAIFNTTELFNGLLDDVRVYSTALSESEIGRLASQSISSAAPEPTTGLMALLGVVGLGLFRRQRRRRR